MARKVLLETSYTFSPSTRTIVIPEVIPRERLVLITNVTTNQVIYNFSDPNLKATSYTTSGAANANTTTIVLNYNTASMSSTDKLQITIDEYSEKFTPSETYTDPVNKLRVSQPQALIDTDFEYGTQITKWENLGLVNNRPYSFPSATPLTGIGTILMPANSRTVTVIFSAGSSAPGVGTAISVQDTYLNIANGNYTIETVGAGGTNLTYTARATNTTGITQLFDSNKTSIYSGSTYTNAQIGGTPTFAWTSGTALPITTTVPHGLSLGNEVAIVGSSQVNANGTWKVARITSPTAFTVYSAVAPAANPTGGQIFALPQAQFLHRPFDGGVIFSTNGDSNYEQATRQTRRYFRYQSGKGIQISSGTILKPNLQIDSLTSSGTTVTIQTKEQHNIQTVVPGTTITVSGANESAYNGTFTVTGVTGYNRFTYTANSTPSASPASGDYIVAVNSWYGCFNRLGAFDSQNGVFFEFDGQTLYAVRRTSTYQISGKVTVTQGSNTVTQTDSGFPTYFSRQLQVGNYVVIRGATYRVIDIASDTSMTISPSYRGATSTFAIVTKTNDVKVPQSQWNIDKCDGTGPSGFNIDLTKMQMFYIDYSWYGAGFVRWGFRGPTGDIIYCHKAANNNINSEAYMRSGNLPARYESETRPPTTYITANVGASDTTVGIASTAGFPTSGTVVIRDASKYEYVNYTGITTNSLTGLIRGQSGNTSLNLTVPSGTNVATASTTNIQVGQRVIGTNIPDGTYVASIGAGTITLSQAVTATDPTGVIFAPMGASSGQAFTYSATAPVPVEYAFPTYAPTISHWGTSVIMDGRFDDDKSLVFTYGQTTATGIATNTSRALFSIRVAPSVDNGNVAAFGARELVNRMQLTLRALDITTSTPNANLLVTAVLNGTPSTATPWTNAIGNVTGISNSSLAQIADYSAGATTTVSGGEVTAGFFVGSGANSIPLDQVRDLGNCVLGGGGTNANTQIYPDGPDTLTIVVRNLATNVGGAATVFGRLSWTEAQA